MTTPEDKQSSPAPQNSGAVLRILFILQFLFILDHMLLNPIGPMLIKSLSINQHQFAVLISAYAVGAIFSNTAGIFYLDRFDYKHSLLVSLAGFFLGIVLCATAYNYETMLIGRFVSGFFGGVLGIISMAVVGALYPPEQRGRAMGIVTSGFGLAPVIGVPTGLLIADKLGWEASFWLLNTTVFIVWLLAYFKMPSVFTPPAAGSSGGWRRLRPAVRERNYWLCFVSNFMSVLSMGILVPYIAIFFIFNLGLTNQTLVWFYFAGGILSFALSRVAGSLIDRISLKPVLALTAVAGMITVIGMTHLELYSMNSLLIITGVGALFMGFSSARMTAVQTMVNVVAAPAVRGAVLSINQLFTLLAFALGPVSSDLIIHDLPQQGITGYREAGYICVLLLSGALLSGLMIYTGHIYKKVPSVYLK